MAGGLLAALIVLLLARDFSRPRFICSALASPGLCGRHRCL
jgi:hypothetical protein